MKNFLSILILTFVSQAVTGQDKISTKDNQQLNVKIIEHTGRVVKYKMNDYEDGPVLWIRTNQITRIDYKNGYTDLMGYQNPRKKTPLGISAGFAYWISEEGGMFSSTLDYFIIPQIDLELNIGSDLGDAFYISGGTRLHLNSRLSQKRLTPFTGLLIGSQYGDGFLQIPVGISYLAKPGLNASLSINEMLFFSSWKATLLELRVGWKFKTF